MGGFAADGDSIACCWDGDEDALVVESTAVVVVM